MQRLGDGWRDRGAALSPRGGLVRLVAVAVPALAAATLLVGLLETRLGVPNASPVYLLAVVATALASGTVGALAAAVVGVLLYDYFFTLPYHTFVISDPGIWLNLVLLLFVGVVVGQLTALERSRTLTAESREREARELFLISRALATRSATMAVLPEIAALLGRAANMTSLSIALGPDDGAERVATEWGTRAAPGGLYWQLRRFPGEQPAQWVRIHAQAPGRPRRDGGERPPIETYRVRIEAGGRSFGSIWAARDRRDPLPDRTATRLVSAAADQIGQALAHDRLAAEASAADVARQSDALKSALLQSVSHDLRTPLATIRAAAGTLRPAGGLSDEDRKESADAIDREVEYLNRLVTNLLDLSRIEAGALRADRDIFELEDLVGRTLERLAKRLVGRPLDVELDAPPVNVDPVFLDEAVTNALENAVKYSSPGTAVRVAAADTGDGFVRLTIEDAGTGVPDEALHRLFEKFYRVPGGPKGSRSGTGIGLAVVHGLVAAMGGRATARQSELGGLAIDLDLPAARIPSSTVAEVAS